jgi:hypothetical protein
VRLLGLHALALQFTERCAVFANHGVNARLERGHGGARIALLQKSANHAREAHTYKQKHASNVLKRLVVATITLRHGCALADAANAKCTQGIGISNTTHTCCCDSSTSQRANSLLDASRSRACDLTSCRRGKARTK